jgi:replicative DNA helicase
MARMISIKSDIYGGLDGTPITTKAVKQLIRNEDVSWRYIRGLTEELCPNFHLYDKPCDIKQIENVTRMAIDNYGPNMIVIVDYLGLIKTKGITDEYAKYSNIALDLQNLAKNLNVFLIFVHQLSRRAGAGEVAVTIDMLRGSGIIEEVSDIVLALWYKLEKDEELHQIQRLPAKPIEVAVLKNRHGPTSSYDYILDTRNLVYRRSNDDMITGWGDLH